MKPIRRGGIVPTASELASELTEEKIMAQNRWWMVVVLLVLALGISVGHNLAPLSPWLTAAAPVAEACAPPAACTSVAPIAEPCKSPICACAAPAPLSPAPEGKTAPSGQPKQYCHFFIKVSFLYKGDGIEADVAKPH